MRLKKFWKSADFLKLKDEWYQRLSLSGFEDCEETIAGEEKLKQNSSNAYKQAHPVERHAKLEYSLMISEGVAQNEFDDDIDRFVMSKINEGMEMTEISKLLKALGCNRWHRQSVMLTKRKYENRWGIRKWRPDQLSTKPPPSKKKLLLTA